MTFEEHIQKGFNAGYQLQKLHPALSEQLQMGFTDKDHPYVQGFTAGREEFAKEKTQETPSLLDKYLNHQPEDKTPPAPSPEKDEPEIEM